MPAGTIASPIESPVSSPVASPLTSPTTSSPTSFHKQVMTREENSLARPVAQKQLSLESDMTKPSTPPSIDPHHKDSVCDFTPSLQDVDHQIDRNIITPSPCVSEIATSTSMALLSDMLLAEMRTLKQQYTSEITSLRNELQFQHETHSSEIATFKRALQRQQQEFSELMLSHEKNDSWRYEMERDMVTKRSKQDVILMELTTTTTNHTMRIQELQSELAHTRARLPMVAATADAAAVSAAAAAASAKALAQRPQRTETKNKKKPRKQSTPLLPTPPRHTWNTMPTPTTQAAATVPSTPQAQAHSQPTSTVTTPRTPSSMNPTPLTISTTTSIPPSRASRFASVPNNKHAQHDSLSDVIGTYLDEDGTMIEDELTLYMKNRGRSHTSPPVQSHQGMITSMSSAQSQTHQGMMMSPSQSQTHQGMMMSPSLKHPSTSQSQSHQMMMSPSHPPPTQGVTFSF